MWVEVLTVKDLPLEPLNLVAIFHTRTNNIRNIEEQQKYSWVPFIAAVTANNRHFLKQLWFVVFCLTSIIFFRNQNSLCSQFSFTINVNAFLCRRQFAWLGKLNKCSGNVHKVQESVQTDLEKKFFFFIKKPKNISGEKLMWCNASYKK